MVHVSNNMDKSMATNSQQIHFTHGIYICNTITTDLNILKKTYQINYPRISEMKLNLVSAYDTIS